MKLATSLNKLVMPEAILFGLPWTLSGLLLALWGHPLEGGEILWRLLYVVFAFTGARTAGMAFNRLIDHEIDEANPRTKSRLLPSGQATRGYVWYVALLSTLLLLASSWQLGGACFMASPVIVFLLVLYPYMKRFSAACHLVLGAIQFFGPYLAWVAVTGESSIAAVYLGLAVWASIAGMDIVYALQDRSFDQEHGLHSIPVLLGEKGALLMARLLTALTVLLVYMVGSELSLPLPFYISVFAMGLVYFRFHWAVAMGDEIDGRFFNCNRIVALLLFFGCVASFLQKVLVS